MERAASGRQREYLEKQLEQLREALAEQRQLGELGSEARSICSPKARKNGKQLSSSLINGRVFVGF